MTPRLAAALLLITAAASSAEDREADHKELRAMLVTLRDAVNQRQLERVEPLLADHIALTFADGTRVTSAADLERYFLTLTDAQSGPVTGLALQPVADDLTYFLAPDVGICYGHSSDTFTLRGGVTRVLDSRWTATVVRQNGAWKLAALQVGANVLDNVVLGEHKRLTRAVGIGGAIAVVAVGLAAFALGRRPKRA